MLMEKCIFASNVASASGLNKYRPVWETFEITWERQLSEPAVKTRQRLQEKNREESTLSTTESRTMAADVFMGEKLETIVSDAKSANSIHDLKAIEKTIEQKVNETLNSDPVHKDRVLKHSFSAVRCAYGTASEERSTKFSNVSGGNSRFYKMKIDSIPGWIIGGRVDGFKDGKLVEIKNRRNRLFNSVPNYERVQLECYMRLLGCDSCTLVQHLQLLPGMIDECKHEVSRSDGFWFNEVIEPLKKFCAAMDIFMQDKELEEAFVCADENGKRIIVEKLLQNV